MEKKKKLDKSQKDKIFFGCGIVVILIISIATANVNLTDRLHQFVSNVWSNIWNTDDETEDAKVASRGVHVVVEQAQAERLMEVYDLLGRQNDKEDAIAVLQEIRTLYYHANTMGITAEEEEIQAYMEQCKTEWRQTNSSKYIKMMQDHGGEKEYWSLVRNDIEEYIVAEKLREQKRREFEENGVEDIEQELSGYVQRLVDYEKFE